MLYRAGVDQIDNHIPEKYSVADIRHMLGLTNTQTMFSLKHKSKAVVSTPFSEFIRNASSAEKKRVYKRVLEKASESQNRVLNRAASAK